MCFINGIYHSLDKSNELGMFESNDGCVSPHFQDISEIDCTIKVCISIIWCLDNIQLDTSKV